MKNNGSKEPIFETDDDRSYFLTILLGHTGTKIKGPVDEPVDENSIENIEVNGLSLNILLVLDLRVQSSKDIAKNLNIETKHGAMKRAMKRLRELKLIEYTIPDKPNSSKQEYRLTKKGQRLVLKENGGNR